MSLLFETIKIAGGKIINLPLHKERMNRSRYELFGAKDIIHIEDFIKVMPEMENIIIRCRVIYDLSVRSVEYSQYKANEIKTIKLVDGDSIDYSYKYLDRSSLNVLVDKRLADDILIIKNGYVTDCSFANIVFHDGYRWITPNTPLLRGTMREMLLKHGVIKEETIMVDELQRFSHFRLINSMLGFEAPVLPVKNIII
ncbi:MAG: aminotransferase class IV [Bacteroidales bacterium]